MPTGEAVSGLTSVLHPTEQAEIEALPPAARPETFARCWTRKEAYLKGKGIGLGEDPATTPVGAGPRPARVTDWTLTDVPVPDGYAAACAVHHRPD